MNFDAAVCDETSRKKPEFGFAKMTADSAAGKHLAIFGDGHRDAAPARFAFNAFRRILTRTASERRAEREDRIAFDVRAAKISRTRKMPHVSVPL